MNTQRRWSCGLDVFEQRNVPMSERTTFRIGGLASLLIEPPDESAFALAYAAALKSGMPVRILGGGSNLLIADEGVDGIVLSTAQLRDHEPLLNGERVRVRAGTHLSAVVRYAAEHGLTGLECMAGIPGTIGGAVWMNAGSRHGSIGSVVDAVWCADRNGGMAWISGRAIRWEYRCSNIPGPILTVELQLERDYSGKVAKRVADIVAKRRTDQQADVPSAGCFFKNPPGNSAGRMIDDVGLKGYRVGQACVSDRHANFILNLGGASASDVLNLTGEVRERVYARYGIVLENEVSCWPEGGFPRWAGQSERGVLTCSGK